MKHILITGSNSYIGTSFENWLNKYPNEYDVKTIDMQNKNWCKESFKGYDAVFHVAGIAHVSTDPSMEEIYYKVNRDLTAQTALKAKDDGIPLFIFMSSIIVYGDSSPIGQQRIITEDTKPEPANFYGQSKLQAEEKLHELEDDSFEVAIIRPPMIYGPGSKGNYPKLSKIAQKFSFFPLIHNERSVLFIDNLCQCLKNIVDSGHGGTFFPQNKDFAETIEIVETIARTHNKKIHLTIFFNPAIKLLSHKVGAVNKAFGSLCYDKKLSGDINSYQTCSFEESIIKTEHIH